MEEQKPSISRVIAVFAAALVLTVGFIGGCATKAGAGPLGEGEDALTVASEGDIQVVEGDAPTDSIEVKNEGTDQEKTPVEGGYITPRTVVVGHDIEEGVPYIDENGDEQVSPPITEINNDRMKDMKGVGARRGWYVVTRDCEYKTRFEVLGDVKIILADGVTVTFKDGIHCARGKLTIYGQKGQSGKLVAESKWGQGASIGSNNGQDNDCEIVIAGGTIEAEGSPNAAAIGGGKNSGAGAVRVLGGAVTAVGYGREEVSDSGGCGIGSGSYATGGGSVEISGGTVNVVGGILAAGIGVGYGAQTSPDVTISGGVVTAVAKKSGVGIGNALGTAPCNVTICGDANVTAQGGEHGAGIGGMQSVSVLIKDQARVNATGGLRGAGIGGSEKCPGCTVNICGNATVTATGGEKDAAGIGGGSNGDGGTISISGSANVTALGGYNGAGIGGGDNHAGGTITIADNATVRAIGGVRAAGIGGGDDGGSGDIRIDGCAHIEAMGKDGAASIGRGQSGKQRGAITVADTCDICVSMGIKGEKVKARPYERLAFLTVLPYVVIEPAEQPEANAVDGEDNETPKADGASEGQDDAPKADEGDDPQAEESKPEAPRPTITIGEQYRAEKGDVRGVGVAVTRNVPKGWKLLEQGVLYARDFRYPNVKNFTLGAKGVKYKKSTNREPNGSTKVNVSVANNGVRVTHRGYMKVRNLVTGEEETLYTEIVTSSYDDCDQ